MMLSDFYWYVCCNRCLYYDASQLVANKGWPTGVRSVELSLAVNVTDADDYMDQGNDFRQVIALPNKYLP